jgi:fructokinase
MRIGVDLGGTKIEIAALGPGGKILLRERESSHVGSYDATIRAVKGLVEAAEAKLGRRATVGIGTPGAISPATGLIKNANSTWLNGKPFDHDMAAALGREVRVANDANCFTLSEAVDGAGAGKRVVFGVIVGTGTGGGIAVEGRVLTGANAIAGEWGHNPMPWPKPEWGEVPGPPCYGAQPGCIEVYLSGPGLASDHARVTGEKREPGDIERAAAAGEAPARATMARYHDRFARALAHVINLLDPDVIVIGGGLSNINTIYTEVPPLMQPYVFSDVCTTPVVKNKHGDSGGVRGAAWLWREDEAPD